MGLCSTSINFICNVENLIRFDKPWQQKKVIVFSGVIVYSRVYIIDISVHWHKGKISKPRVLKIFDVWTYSIVSVNSIDMQITLLGLLFDK